MCCEWSTQERTAHPSEAAAWAEARAAALAAAASVMESPARRSPRLAPGAKRSLDDNGVAEAAGPGLETAASAADVEAAVEAAAVAAENLPAVVVLAAPGPRKCGRPHKAAAGTGSGGAYAA